MLSPVSGDSPLVRHQACALWHLCNGLAERLRCRNGVIRIPPACQLSLALWSNDSHLPSRFLARPDGHKMALSHMAMRLLREKWVRGGRE